MLNTINDKQSRYVINFMASEALYFHMTNYKMHLTSNMCLIYYVCALNNQSLQYNAVFHAYMFYLDHVFHATGFFFQSSSTGRMELDET